MRKLAFASLFVISALGAYLGLQGNSPRAADNKPATHKLEYIRISWLEVEEATAGDARLNRMGNEGWELCGVVTPNGASATQELIFKRPKD